VSNMAPVLRRHLVESGFEGPIPMIDDARSRRRCAEAMASSG
jgi:hypothetical protein